MKATILSHMTIMDGGDPLEIHRFGYSLDDGETALRFESVSLRTARALVAELESGNAFVKMLQLIVETDPASCDSLVGTSFSDSRTTRTGARSE
jgi:hypothetical protein